ncbi:MAG: PAS domain S-box protein [Actinomycetes bacterium]
MSDPGGSGAVDHSWVAGLFQEIDDCLYLKDPEGRYLDVNAAAAEMLGGVDKEIVGYTDADFFPRHLADAIRADDRRVLLGERVLVHEQLPHADGTPHLYLTRKAPWTDGDGHIRGVAGISTDITETLSTRTALAESEARFQALFENAPIGKAVVALDGSWLDVNPAFERIVGYSKAELLTTNAEDLTHPEDVNLDITELGDLLDRRRTHYMVEKRYVRSDGKHITVQLHVALMRNEDGTPRYFIYQIADISERLDARRQLEEALRTSEQANAELRRADELKDHLLTVTSHELRSPLTVIRGFAETLHRRYDSLPDADRRDALEAMARQARRLDALISDLLTLSMLRADALHPVLARTPVADVATEIGERYPETVLEIAEGLAVVADPQWLTDVLNHLVANGFQHGRAPVTLAGERSGDAALIVVEDHGAGVPADFAAALFERFTQADTGLRRRTSGVGLGLAVVAELTTAMGGDVWYEQAAHGGARMSLRLPLAD